MHPIKIYDGMQYRSNVELLHSYVTIVFLWYIWRGGLLKDLQITSMITLTVLLMIRVIKQERKCLWRIVITEPMTEKDEQINHDEQNKNKK